MKVWVSYYLQDGTQMGAVLYYISPKKSIYEQIVRILAETEGSMWSGIADYGICKEV